MEAVGVVVGREVRQPAEGREAGLDEGRPPRMDGPRRDELAHQDRIARRVGNGEAGVAAEGVVLRGHLGGVGDVLGGLGHGLSPLSGDHDDKRPPFTLEAATCEGDVGGAAGDEIVEARTRGREFRAA